MSMSAFPIAISAKCISWEEGMTLRDYFAGQALIGLLSDGKHFMFTSRDGAKRAYDMADAMLKARSA
jgi:hypothetical protein